ncbi:response regulator transcription factor [Pseudomarimonas arenosa]|uniref:Response regulator transcription factor n=1 Tax=Pseudomarimonas arenosa TaxID=2774145 RepID=A0AAW3ZM18_9GAMM|nr:response regulator transcription factor [Pseudomarimonas arenosa]MBD8526520.1 response regulator transcription factor [Pseudomarimonas arenosa]
MTQVLVADDHPLYRNALVQALRELGAAAEVHQAGSLSECQSVLSSAPEIDLVLLDLHMPDSHGLMGLATLRAEFPAVAVALISAHDDPHTIRRALDYGAAGFIPKSIANDELQAALRALLNCEEYLPAELHERVRATRSRDDDTLTASRLAKLTPQQFKVLTRVAEGQLNKQIADDLGISERTVKAHLSALFEKLDVRNRTQAGVLLRSLELSDPSKQLS